jgi:hypothetical protein
VEAGGLHPRAEVQDQVILPLRVALGICLSGIRTRLGRSVVTLLGVALGISFLMAVLASVHIQRAMRRDAEMAREIERRLTAIRGEVGSLRGKTFFVVAADRESDRPFLRALAAQGATVHAAEDAPARADAVLLLAGGGGGLPTAILGALRDRLVLAFDALSGQAETLIAAQGGRVRHLGIELRPDELARARDRETLARYRLYWILAVSLLITVGSIANAMLMSVTERFREIGTMKCLGALSSFVVKLFFLESSLIGLVGSVIGSVAGAAFALAAYSCTFQAARVFAAVDFAALGARAGLCVAAGVVLAIVAAIYPARVAARMIPAAALASNV